MNNDTQPGPDDIRGAIAQAFLNSFKQAEQHLKQVEKDLPPEIHEQAAQEAAKEWREE